MSFKTSTGINKEGGWWLPQLFLARIWRPGPRLEKCLHVNNLYWQELELRTAFAQIWRPAPKPPECSRHFQKVRHLEDVRTPNGLGPDLAAKRVVELLETRLKAIWIPAALGPAERVFEMRESNTDLEQVWTSAALRPDLAARHQAERLFGMLTRISHLKIC